jgi:hypothetical protein
MSSQRPDPPASRDPSDQVTDLTDPRALTLLTTEHWSLLSARALAYNEAFVRGGMFLTFLSMSFVALGLLAQATRLGEDFVPLAVIVLAFDLVIGLATYARILGANSDDFVATHGMARIRHGYTQIAPMLERYFTSPTHDDPVSLLAAYRRPSTALVPGILYGLTTSGGMIGLITSMVGGVLVAAVALIGGLTVGAAMVAGAAGGIGVFAILLAITVPILQGSLYSLPSEFPAPEDGAASEPVRRGEAEPGLPRHELDAQMWHEVPSLREANPIGPAVARSIGVVRGVERA